MATITTKKQHLPSSQDEYDYDFADEDASHVTRSPSSVRRYRQPAQSDDLDVAYTQQGQGTLIQRRRSSLNPHATNGVTSNAIVPIAAKRERRSQHFYMIVIVLGMLVMALLVFGLSAFGRWWQGYQNDITYGRPRKFQFNAVVGHGDSQANPTHFILLNLNRHVEIIELPGGDASHVHVYIGPVLLGDGQDLTPVTGEVRDVNGDGKPDLILHIQDQQIVFINDGKGFHPQ